MFNLVNTYNQYNKLKTSQSELNEEHTYFGLERLCHKTTDTSIIIAESIIKGHLVCQYALDSISVWME